MNVQSMCSLFAAGLFQQCLDYFTDAKCTLNVLCYLLGNRAVSALWLMP